MVRRSVLIACAALLAGCGDGLSSPNEDAGPRALRVLFFQEEGADVGWFHTSNPVADRVMTAIGVERGWETTTAKTSTGYFTPEVLNTFDVVVYLISSGTVLEQSERDALVAFMALGKGYVGVHSASFTDPDWQWYIDLVGTRFATESDGLYSAGVLVENRGIRLGGHLSSPWTRTDQWYVFLTPPEDNRNLQILLSLDEDSLAPTYPDGIRVGYHPIAWRQFYGGGRSFYTAMGHTNESYEEPAFVTLIADGIEWAGGPSRFGTE